MKHLLTTIAFFAFAGIALAQTATPTSIKWSHEDDVAMRQAFSEGKTVEQVAAQFGRSTSFITGRARLVHIVIPDAALPAPAATPEAIPANAKKILVAANSLSHPEQQLVEGLRAKGYFIVFAAQGSTVDKVDAVPEGTTTKITKEGSVPAHMLARNLPPESVRDYEAFIILKADSASNMGLPIDAILVSGKLVVMGEVDNVSAGEKRLHGQPVYSNSPLKAFRIEGSGDRLTYTIYRGSPADKEKGPEAQSKFVSDKLLPRILAGL